MAKEPFDEFQKRLEEIARQHQQQYQQIVKDQAREQFLKGQAEQARILREQQFAQQIPAILAEIERIPAQEEIRGREQVQQLRQEAIGLHLGEMATSIKDDLWQRATPDVQISLTEVSQPDVKLHVKLNTPEEREAVEKAYMKTYGEKSNRLYEQRPVYNWRGKHVSDEWVLSYEEREARRRKLDEERTRVLDRINQSRYNYPPQTNSSYFGWLLSYPCHRTVAPFEYSATEWFNGDEGYEEYSVTRQSDGYSFLGRNELFIGFGYVNNVGLVVPEAKAYVTAEGVKAYIIGASGGEPVGHGMNAGEYYKDHPYYTNNLQAIPVTYPGSQQVNYNRILKEAERLSPINFRQGRR